MLRGRPGDCLLVETNREAGYIKAHLFVILIEAEDHTQNTIIVNIQSIRDGKYDKTVVLRRGDHPFIEHDSYVNYRLAKIFSLVDLEQMIMLGTASVKQPFDHTVFQKICDGIAKSPFTPAEVVEMYQRYVYNRFLKPKASGNRHSEGE